MLHTFNGSYYTKNERYIKKRDYNHIFYVFLIFRGVGSIESMQHGYSLDEGLNFHPMSTPARNLSKQFER